MSTASKFKFVLRNIAQPVVGWEKWNQLQFKAIHGYRPNFSNPKTFLEYLQFLKYYGGGGLLAPFIDKLAVKDFVGGRVGQNYVVPTKSVIYPNEAIDFSVLPDRWIAKSAHAAGWNHLHDGGEITEMRIRVKIRKWLKRNYYDISGETNYRYIAPKVIFEPLISDFDEDLKDYKIWCFAGEPLFIGVHGDRKEIPKGQIFNLGWEATNWSYPEIPTWDEIPEQPTNLEELLHIARELSRDFPFVRVDLYDGSRGVFFGELTFTPGDGNNIRIPHAEDLRFGQMILGDRTSRRIGVNYHLELHH